MIRIPREAERSLIMFDFAWSELALIAVVALVVIGPKDLPRVMRTLGFWLRRARAVAHEFQGSVEQMVREAELDEVRQHVEKAAQFNVEDEITRHIDPRGEIHEALADPTLHEPAAALPAPEPEPQAAEDAPASPPHRE
jgi:sec-independent protein translocase protein TatB